MAPSLSFHRTGASCVCPAGEFNRLAGRARLAGKIALKLSICRHAFQIEKLLQRDEPRSHTPELIGVKPLSHPSLAVPSLRGLPPIDGLEPRRLEPRKTSRVATVKPRAFAMAAI